MEKSEVQERVIKVVCEVLNIDADMVTLESNFVFDLGAESMQSVQLVAGFDMGSNESIHVYIRRPAIIS